MVFRVAYFQFQFHFRKIPKTSFVLIVEKKIPAEKNKDRYTLLSSMSIFSFRFNAIPLQLMTFHLIN